MPLPPLIEIVPLPQPVRAEITIPGSKSITNRALVLAALREGETMLRGALWSEDTQVMVACLRELGFMVNVDPDAQEPGNRTITVYGLGGAVPQGGTEENPLDLLVGNAGTAARFLAAMVCLGNGVYRLSGVPRMHERPQAALFKALRALGYRVDSPNDKLPALIYGSGPKPGRCRVNIAESSQFASALLLAAGAGGWQVEIEGENADESPYVAMTHKLNEAFSNAGTVFQIEPDCSSGSYFWAAGQAGTSLAHRTSDTGNSPSFEASRSSRSVTVAHWPASGWQVDEHFVRVWHRLEQPASGSADSPRIVSRRQDLGDSIMTAIALAPLLPSPVTFTELGRLRLQECERVAALRTELTKCGARVVEQGDTLILHPAQPHGAEIATYNDHRLAMCFAILGLKVAGIKIKNPACVKKTFPNFFQKLAAPPPSGLGAVILDGGTGARLSDADLFAD